MTKRDVTAELKQLRLHGMAAAWSDLVSQSGSTYGDSGVGKPRWLLELGTALTSSKMPTTATLSIFSAQWIKH